MKQNETNLETKRDNKYHCKKCDYYTSHKGHFEKHINSIKHNKSHIETKETKVTKSDKVFIEQCLTCQNCGENYISRTSLWRHKKICYPNKNSTNDNNNNDKELIMMLIKENSELKSMMMEVIKNGTHNTTNTNSHNKAFNLNFFLNDTCKDAMNMSEFIESIQVQISDLENTGKLGYVEGISNIFLNNLKDLDTHMRPIHCSDLRRETLYIKDDNEWSKDTDEKTMLTKAIKQVTKKNIKQITEWIKKYPDCIDSESKKNDQYLKIVSNAMSGGTIEEQKNNINKIIKNVVKEITINKQN